MSRQTSPRISKAERPSKAREEKSKKKTTETENTPTEDVQAAESASFRFVTFTRRQLLLLTWWAKDSRYADYNGVIADGAIRTGKTLCGSMSFVFWAMSSFNGFNFAFCGKTTGALHRNVVTPQFIQILRTRGYGVRERHDGGSNYLIINKGAVSNRFYFFGGNDVRSQDLIQGITLAGVFFDEVALQPESFVNQATGRCSVKGSKFFFNCNPAERLHWFKINWINKYIEKKLLYIHFTMDDNAALAQETIERYKSMYVGVFFRRYIEGMWVAAEGVIYGDSWSNEENTYVHNEGEEQPWEHRSTRRYVAIDYGTTNPTVFLDAYDDGNTFWIAKEYYQDSRKEQRQLTPSQHAEALEKFLNGDHTPIIIIDPAAEAFRIELRNRGFRVKEADNSVLEGIRTTSTMMLKRRIKVNRECKGFLAEVESYVWDEKAAERGEEKPLKERDHCLAGDTVVHTLFGKRFLKDLVGKIGLVWCFNERKRRKALSFFFGARSAGKQMVYEVELQDGRKIKATEDHKVLTKRGWVEVKDLIEGDEITGVNTQPLYQNNAAVKAVRPIGIEEVYDLSVLKHHNFAVNGGLIVHNCMDALRYLIFTTVNRARLMTA